ncbi:hypothetical protein F5ESL0261_05390 [Lactobacillus sp. ESL0261]|nr:hypothetical protein F5ESL0261_05390 [Lactobacillus sp. ESL0261]
MIDKLKNIPFFKKLNSYKITPVICWSILVMILPLLFSLFSIGTIYRVGLLFIVLNSIISYHIGKLIKALNLRHYWLLFMPGCFCLIVLLKYANYNFLFALIYLILEIFGLMDNQIYG